ncbi:hypothetical protein EVAR_12762_1 [Eumeta japonica]|uniref:Uncharacterized protein n=1 Tax=Eumeta variegata TaxID=151549 RepID=A0A4C1UC13_EUMVA|nr:hypothetical protein EVAR_12762_1 [Eumeta japonica]
MDSRDMINCAYRENAMAGGSTPGGVDDAAAGRGVRTPRNKDAIAHEFKKLLKRAKFDYSGGSGPRQRRAGREVKTVQGRKSIVRALRRQYL